MIRRSARRTEALVGGDSVPLSERLSVMQAVRAAAIALVAVCAVLAPQALDPSRRAALLTTGAFAVLVAGAQVVLRFSAERAAALMTPLLMLDGLWLAWTSYLTGALASPVRYLVLLHIGAVSLLASYRTGLKMAMWHSLLLLATWNGVQGGWLAQTDPHVGSSFMNTEQRMALFVVVLWLVAVSTSALSAVNERELRRRRLDLEALTSLAEKLERTSDSASVARTLLDAAVELHGFPRGVVLAGPEGTLPLLASVGLEPETARRPGRPGASAVVQHAQATHSTVLVDGLDLESDPWLSHLMPGASRLVVLPLHAEGRPLGALVVEHTAGRIPRRVVAGLERSASYAALALRNAWLLEQVQRLAATDGLTKIANRRTFEATLEREVARATRAAEHVSLVMIDIDHFKKLNDEHGHQAGDEVLRNVAAALSCECRDFDTPARYGGEEFAVVLPGCGPEEARQIAERLRRAASQAPSVVPITASAGVATYPAHAVDADSLVRSADNALYASKAGGRDRTTVADHVAPEAQVDALLRKSVQERLTRKA